MRRVKAASGLVETRGRTRDNPWLAPGLVAAMEAELLADPKEAAEHLMLVDLGRNDLGRVCEPGSVTVVEFMKVRRYSHVMHLEAAVVDKTKAAARATDDFVHEEPWKAVGVAAALGLALGVLIGRR